jgi:C_GCAxxG_C_C family probable redox protein
MTRKESAVTMHTAGSACSQAVFTVLAKDLGMPAPQAHRLAGGFGGGIGRMGLTCGAVTGGIMALSLALGASESADQEAKLALYGIVADYIGRLKAYRGTIECRALLDGADLWTQEGRDMVKTRRLAESVCNPMIAMAVEEAERILREKGKLGV